VANDATVPSVAERPAEALPAAVRPAPRPTWRLQVGAFRDRANAIELASKLSEHFDGVHVTADEQRGAPLYRVRVDGRGSEADLRAAVTALRAAGHESFRVP
jgi:cell division protein FtsN